MVKEAASKRRQPPKQRLEVPSARTLLAGSWTTYRDNWWLLLKFGLLTAGLNLALSLLNSPYAQNYLQQVWYVIVFAAVVWAVPRLRDKKPLTAAEMVYDGSNAFIKQLLVLMAWTVFLLPFLVGTVVAAQVSSVQFGASTLEIVIANVVWIMLSALSIYWLLRALFAPFYALTERPMAALRTSWRLTKRMVNKLFLRMIIGLLVGLLPVSLLLILWFTPLAITSVGQYLFLLLQDLLVFAFVLPFITLYFYQLKPYEKPRSTRRKTTK